MDPIADNLKAADRLRELREFGYDELWAREIVSIEFGFTEGDRVVVTESEVDS